MASWRIWGIYLRWLMITRAEPRALSSTAEGIPHIRQLAMVSPNQWDFRTVLHHCVTIAVYC